MKREKLLNSLERVTRLVEISSEVGSAIVTEYGGRLLGIFLSGMPNTFWTSSDPAETIEKGDSNIGGNRLWISPERNFFYRNPSSFGDWFCPSSLDPGTWSIMEKDRMGLSLNNSFELQDVLNGSVTSVTLSRRISLASAGELRKGLEYMRFRVKEGMAARGELRNGINLWSLTEIYPGAAGVGSVLVPVRSKAQPVHYFSPVPRDRLRVSRDHIAFKIDGQEVYKLGIRPEDLPCPGYSSVLYYFEPESGQACLVSKSTSMAPIDQSECLDVARADPSGPRGSVQAYNSGPDLSLGEIELHFKPAVKVGNLIVSCADYEMTVFAGSREKVLRALTKTSSIAKPALF